MKYGYQKKSNAFSIIVSIFLVISLLVMALFIYKYDKANTDNQTLIDTNLKLNEDLTNKEIVLKTYLEEKQTLQNRVNDLVANLGTSNLTNTALQTEINNLNARIEELETEIELLQNPVTVKSYALEPAYRGSHYLVYDFLTEEGAKAQISELISAVDSGEPLMGYNFTIAKHSSDDSLSLVYYHNDSEFDSLEISIFPEEVNMPEGYTHKLYITADYQSSLIHLPSNLSYYKVGEQYQMFDDIPFYFGQGESLELENNFYECIEASYDRVLLRTKGSINCPSIPALYNYIEIDASTNGRQYILTFKTCWESFSQDSGFHGATQKITVYI